MLATMHREPCFVSGSTVFSDLGIYAGWVGRPGSFAARHSLYDEDLEVALVFSGECLNNADDAANKNWIIQRYAKLGARFFEELNGLFSGLLIDKRANKTFLFNDRYGLNRIYVHEQAGCIFFSSEAKSLLAVVPALRELDSQGFAEWVSCGCALGNRTLFHRVRLLPPGSAWVFPGDGSVKKKAYFSPPVWEEQPALSPEEYLRKLTNLFPRILPNYLNGAGEVAMSLTGGLDGRMIMAWARPNHGEMPCYTFNGSYRDCADVQIGRKVAVACYQPHQTIPVGDEFLAQFPKLAEQTIRITDGAMDVTGAAELYVNRLARKIKPVRLTGNYGSEILRGHVAFRPQSRFKALFDCDLTAAVGQAAMTYAEEFSGNARSFVAFKQIPWYHFGRFAVEESQLTVRSPYLDNELVELAFQAPEGNQTNFDICLKLVAKGNSKLASIPTDRGVRYGANALSNRLHRSKEHFLVRAEYAYDYGMPNWLARVDSLLSPLSLERHFLGRQKFCHFRTWYRLQLAGYVKDILLDPRSRSRSYLNTRCVEEIVSQHLAGTHNFTLEIHKLLSLELLHRTLLDG